MPMQEMVGAMPTVQVLESAQPHLSEPQQRGWLKRTGLAAAGILLSACGGGDTTGFSQPIPDHQSSVPTARGPEATTEKPNIIFFLADDMSSNELKYMPHVRKLIFEQGATANNFFDSVSLCCSSRASIFNGQYAQNTGIFSNVWPGGFYGYNKANLAQTSFPNILKHHGYTTSLMGKYLNGYVDDPGDPNKPLPSTYLPKGWSDWAVPTEGEFYGDDYQININGKMHHKTAPTHFLSDFTNDRAERLIKQNTDGQGLFIEMSDFGPHTPSPSSPRELNNPRLQAKANALQYPRTPAFNEANVADKPSFIRRGPQLNQEQVNNIDNTWQRRYFSVKTLDRHVAEVVKTLRQTHQLANTYLVFGSDNGYHMGEHRLVPGKNTEYDTDIKVPFGIRGPGIAPGSHISQVIGNIDLAPTFLSIAGITPPPSMDGESLLPLLQGRQNVPWRKDYLIEKGQVTSYDEAGGPTEPGSKAEFISEQNVAKFVGVADDRWRYFEFNNGAGKPLPYKVDGVTFRPGEEEFYDTNTDPEELTNIMAMRRSSWTAEQRAAYDHLKKAVLKLVDCHGAEQCRVTE